MAKKEVDEFGDTNFDSLERDLREAKLFEDDEVVDFIVAECEDKQTKTDKRMFVFKLRAINHATKSSAFLPAVFALLPYRGDDGKMVVVGNILNILKSLGVDGSGKSLSEVFGDASVYVGMTGALQLTRRAGTAKDYAVENNYIEEGEDFNLIKKFFKK